MTNQEMQNEINRLNEIRNNVKKENSVKCDYPKSKRTYTYRKSPAIKSADLVL